MWTVALTLVAHVALPAASPAPPDEVLVLGIRNQYGALSTWLVDKTEIRRVGDGLAVPRADGWWTLEQLHRDIPHVDEQMVWLSPADKPKTPPPLSAEGCDGENQEMRTAHQVLFVGAEFFSVEDSYYGECGGAHASYGTTLRTFRHDRYLAARASAQGSPSPEMVGDALGPPALAAFERAGATAHGGASKREQDCLGDAWPGAWALIRMRGTWVLRGALGEAYGACRGNHEYFSVDSTVPAKITGANPPATPWAEKVRAHPGLLDAMSSPSGAFELLVTPERLELHASGTVVGTVNEPKTAIVMTQWGLGKSAARWRNDVPKALSAPRR